eukprot:scaffold30_cov416-Prasinococcus_capsulatus_cf.AAC.10
MATGEDASGTIECTAADTTRAHNCLGPLPRAAVNAAKTVTHPREVEGAGRREGPSSLAAGPSKASNGGLDLEGNARRQDLAEPRLTEASAADACAAGVRVSERNGPALARSLRLRWTVGGCVGVVDAWDAVLGLIPK